MAECCKAGSEGKPKTQKYDCPTCKQSSLHVKLKTMLHHIKQPWIFHLGEQPYFYCDNPKCDVVYFAADARTINKSAIRTRIGIKEYSDDALVCFCFGISKVDAVANKEVKEFVIKQTRATMCSCETTNPSGRCCLKDFPKFV